jgi:hypothetical protein
MVQPLVQAVLAVTTITTVQPVQQCDTVITTEDVRNERDFNQPGSRSERGRNSRPPGSTTNLVTTMLAWHDVASAANTTWSADGWPRNNWQPGITMIWQPDNGGSQQHNQLNRKE